MKAIAINGSHRKGWNTDLLFQQTLKGAADTGAKTELVQLFDLTFSSCRSYHAFCNLYIGKLSYIQIGDVLNIPQKS